MSKFNFILAFHLYPSVTGLSDICSLVPTEPLEHNDKAPAGAAKGPPLTDDNKVRLVLGIYLLGIGLDRTFGVPTAQS